MDWIGILVYAVLLIGFLGLLCREDPEAPRERTTFRKELELNRANWLKDVGRRAKAVVVNYSRVAVLGLSAFTLLLTASPFLLERSLPQVLFAAASVQAALGFYIYSIGNTMFAIAESMGEPAYVEDGITVNGNATLMIASAGVLIVLGIGNSVNVPGITFTTLQRDVLTFISLLVVNLVFFLPAVLLHGDYHRWREWGSRENGGGLKQNIEVLDHDIDDLHGRIAKLEGEDDTNMSDVMEKLEEISDDVSDLETRER